MKVPSDEGRDRGEIALSGREVEIIVAVNEGGKTTQEGVPAVEVQIASG